MWGCDAEASSRRIGWQTLLRACEGIIDEIENISNSRWCKKEEKRWNWIILIGELSACID